MAATGALPGVEGAATKLFATESLLRATTRLLDANGPAGLVQSHDVTDLGAFYEYCYRFAPVTTIYGGTSEIQRNLVAQRGLGLPRTALRSRDGVRALPDLRLAPDLTAFRAEVREFLLSAMAPARTGVTRIVADLTGWDEEFERSILRAAGDAGILGVSVPVEYGGAGHSPSWQAMVAFEAAYHDAPLIDTAAALVAPTVVAFGDDAQRAELVPATCLGTVTVCTAYTEAGAGSDLSNITTLARLDADRDRFVLDRREGARHRRPQG